MVIPKGWNGIFYIFQEYSNCYTKIHSNTKLPKYKKGKKKEFNSTVVIWWN